MSSTLYIFTKKIMYNEVQISMRTCRARMGAALQGAFAVMQEIPHSDISCYKKIGGRFFARLPIFFLYAHSAFWPLSAQFTRRL